MPFSFKDGEGFTGDWGALREKLQTGETRTVQEISEQEGVSESTAYRQTAEARKEAKANQDAELLQRILELKAQKIGEREIATHLRISYGKVRSLLKKAEVH